MEIRKVLVLAPHTDDGEIGCGATISKYIREGKEVFYVAFSDCEQSLPDGFPSGTLKHELLDATHMLGIPKDNVTVLQYQVRNFATKRQDILDDMIKLDKNIHPDIVFMPSTKDIHQDHFTIATEGLRAFKRTSIFCYEVPWNNYSFDNQAFSCVEEQDIQNKISAIKCYKSQGARTYTSEQFTRSLLITHGVQVGVNFAEVFEVPRLII